VPEPVEAFVTRKRVSRGQSPEQSKQGIQRPVAAQLPFDRMQCTASHYPHLHVVLSHSIRRIPDHPMS